MQETFGKMVLVISLKGVFFSEEPENSDSLVQHGLDIVLRFLWQSGLTMSSGRPAYTYALDILPQVFVNV